MDITVAADAAQIASLHERLEREGFTLARQHGAAALSGPDFLRFVSANGDVVIEIQTAKTDLQRSVLQRAVLTAEGIRVATVEDLIVLKLIADRPKDQADIQVPRTVASRSRDSTRRSFVAVSASPPCAESEDCDGSALRRLLRPGRAQGERHRLPPGR